MADHAKTEIGAPVGVPQVVTSREFAAPRALVFRAYTEPELLVQWFGPRDLTLSVERLEVRHSGTWHYTNQDASGTVYGFHGVFHGTPSAEEGIVQTFEYEGAAGHVSLETITFEDRGGRTLVRTNQVFQSVADRDAMIEWGMERGINDSAERLDELLARLTRAI